MLSCNLGGMIMGLFKEKRATISVILCLTFMIIGWILEKNQVMFYPVSFMLAILFGGFKQTKQGILETIQNRRLNVDLLMALAAIGACITGNWFEGAMLTFIFSLSGTMEEYTMNKSKKEISSLMNKQPETAFLLTNDGRTVETDVNDLAIGDRLLVPKGANIPIDGILVKGVSTVDESAISGESVPVEKVLNDELFSGTLNLGEAFTMEVTKMSQDTLFAKIIRLVDEARNTPSQTMSFIEKIENIYVKLILIMIPLMVAIPYFFFNWSWNESFYHGMVLLVVASPCALVVSATPAILAAISNGAKNGVLFKGGAFLENIADLSAITFDKTGTLTKGVPTVTDVIFLSDQEEATNVLVAMERQSTHPLAQAIVRRFESESTSIRNQEELVVQNVIGLGMEAVIDGVSWKVGSLAFGKVEQLSESLTQHIDQLHDDGKTVIYLFKNEEMVGYFGLIDVPKPEAGRVLRYFRDQGIHTTMLTGDHEKTAQAVGRILEIDEIHAGCLPAGKAFLIKEQKNKYGVNAMVGDGINDTPALANATIGVAMGEGTDIAIDVADVVLMQNDLEKLQMSHLLSKKLKRIVSQNIIFSVIAILTLIVASFFQIINLPLGVVFHEGTTILVILNGLRMLRKIPLPTST